MRGRPPGDPALRKGKGTVPTAERVEADATAAPELLKFPPRSLFGEKVHPLTRRWWREVIQASPFAPRWLRADVDLLWDLARLKNEWYCSSTPTVALSDAIARQTTRVPGLDAMSRKRFDWRIEGARATPAKAAPVAAAPIEPEADDPRRVLRMLK